MSKRNDRPKPATPKREFAFSRVAGVSPTEYAAVSSLAVGALIVAPFGLLSLAWVWWLAADLVSILMALLALYYMATSAGTLTGRKLALTAIVMSTVFAAAGTVRQVAGYFQQQADTRHVRALAQQACDDVAAGDLESLYEQLAPDCRKNLPLSYWRYQWRRQLGARGRPRHVELSGRMLTASTGEIVTTMRIDLDGPEVRLPFDLSGRPIDRAMLVRLVYARRASENEPSAAGAGSPEEPASVESWQLTALPPFVQPLPAPYAEAVVWPTMPWNGRDVEWMTRDQAGNLVSAGTTVRPPQPATGPDNQPIVEVLVPVVPPDPMRYRDGTPFVPPPPGSQGRRPR